MSAPIQKSSQFSFCPREETKIEAKISVYEGARLLSVTRLEGTDIDLLEQIALSLAKTDSSACFGINRVNLMKASWVKKTPEGRFRVAVERQEFEGEIPGVLRALRGIFSAESSQR